MYFCCFSSYACCKFVSSGHVTSTILHVMSSLFHIVISGLFCFTFLVVLIFWSHQTSSWFFVVTFGGLNSSRSFCSTSWYSILATWLCLTCRYKVGAKMGRSKQDGILTLHSWSKSCIWCPCDVSYPNLFLFFSLFPWC